MDVRRGAWPRRGRATQFQAEDDAGQAAGTRARARHGAAAAPAYLDLGHHDPRLGVLIQHAGDEVLQILGYVGPAGERHVGSLRVRHAGPLGARGRRRRGAAGRYSLVWELQGLALDLTVQTHDPLVHERALRREARAAVSAKATRSVLASLCVGRRREIKQPSGLDLGKDRSPHTPPHPPPQRAMITPTTTQESSR